MPRTNDMEAIAKQYINKINGETPWEPFKHNIGPRIKNLRERMGYGKSEFAKKAGIDRSSLERYESEDAIPRGSTLCKMLKALYCDVVMFTKIEDIEEFNVCAERNFATSENVYDFKEELEARLNSNMSYFVEDKRHIVPNEVMDVLRSNITAALEVLDTLPHDNKYK